MRKIASPQDLQAELRQIMASIQNSELPSRGAIASKLNELADRVAAEVVKAVQKKAGTKTAMDTAERDLYDDLWLRATNDSRAYAKRDAKSAVTNAWLEWQKDERQMQRENYRSVQRKLIADLAAYWAKEGEEDPGYY